MLLKFNNIDMLASFRGYSWSKSMQCADNCISNDSCFGDINIIYGTNGSGKTSLSRIVRSWENGKAFQFSESPTYNVEFGKVGSRTSKFTHERASEITEKVTVFNSDFVEENFGFHASHSGEGHITSFAIVGQNNNGLKEKIDALRQELGEEGKCGLKAEKEQKGVELKEAEKDASDLRKNLNKLQSDLANNVIKKNPNYNQFQTYNVPKLLVDIDFMRNEGCMQLTDERVKEIKKTLDLPSRELLKKYSLRNYDINSLAQGVVDILQTELEITQKIESLLYDGDLSAWVKEGMRLHQDRSDYCAFCGNPISPNRWEELHSHFNEEVQNFEKRIEQLAKILNNERAKLKSAVSFDEYVGVPLFNDIVNPLHIRGEKLRKSFIEIIDELLGYLEWRKKHILFVKVLPLDYTEEEKEMQAWESDVSLCVQQVNGFIKDLSIQKNQMRNQLRYNCIGKYLSENGYEEIEKKISAADAVVKERKTKFDNVQKLILDKETLISQYESQYVSEEAAAEKINKYLKKFGNTILSLHAVSSEEKIGEPRGVYFEVRRGEQRAYNLSEGESRMIAFCYFMATLPAKINEDDPNEEAPTYPIIWIDDPICSLDASHIYDVYALICSEILDKKRFQQIFISTHNLEFLRYLKRLSVRNCKLHRYVVEKFRGKSELKKMPKYLEKFVSEFNALFEIVYRCSREEKITDGNFELFRYLPNSMRRFFELYFTYLYPDGNGDEHFLLRNLKKWCGKYETDMAYQISRICNEGSHMLGRLETGILPAETDDKMIRVARYVVSQIKQNMPDQYDCFLVAINASEDASAQEAAQVG